LIFHLGGNDGKEAFFMSKASNKLSLHIGSEISLKDFSFSQLIIEVKRLFDTEGIPGFIKILVILIEKMLIKNGIQCPSCSSEKLHFHSKSDRKLKTSIGEVSLSLSRLKCVYCKKTFTPFSQLMDLDLYSRKSFLFWVNEQENWKWSRTARLRPIKFNFFAVFTRSKKFLPDLKGILTEAD
jgi:hypothetical protein